MGNVERRTISIPEDLDKRMKKADKTEDVNWSQVAAAAFEVKLAEISAKKEAKTMDDVVQRLRASKQQGEGRDFQEGMKSGKEWAQKEAEWAELERLAKMHSDPRLNDLWRAHASRFNGSSCFDFLMETAFTSSDLEDIDREEFAQQWFGVTAPSDDAVDGFWQGAVEVYDEVAKQL